MNLSNSKKEILILIVVLIFVIVAAIAIKSYNNANVEKDSEAVQQEEQIYIFQKISDNFKALDMSNRSCLNGAKKINDYSGPIFAISIDNYIDAQPQTGIEKANLVIEAPVEAKITRWLAFFDLSTVDELEKIGPVRSARPYFLDWLSPYQAIFMHVGGSPEALSNIKEYGINDLDQFFYSHYYWRDKTRYAPHNVYSSQELMELAVENREIEAFNDYHCYQFEENIKNDDDELVENIKVKNYWPAYTVNWEYQPEDNTYLRYNNKSVYKTLTGSQILAKNVIIIIADVEIIDDYGRRKIDTINSGQSFIFNNGSKINATWKKESREARIRFLDEQGNEISFYPGLIWIHVIDGVDNLVFDISE